MSIKHKTREEWLRAGVEAMKPLLEETGVKMPKKYHVTVSWNKGSGDKGIGQCFDASCSNDGAPHMSVSPCQADPLRVLDILLHEMIHAACGTACGHKGEFKRVALALGFEGKMTATYVTDKSPLLPKLKAVAKTLGDYPHSAINYKKQKKPSKGGWIRLQSPQEESYRVVVSPKMLEEHGYPQDPWGNEMEHIPE